MWNTTRARSSGLAHDKALSALCGLLTDAVLGRRTMAQELPGIDWFRVIELAQRRRVIATLANSHLVEEPNVPEGVRQLLADLAVGTTRSTQVVSDQLAEIASILNSIGIIPMLLKGSAQIASRLYPHPAMRQLSDMDILLPEKDLPAAAEHLASAGYVSEGPFTNRRWHHWPRLVHPDRHVFIELHRWPVAYPYSRLFDLAAIDETAQALELSGSRVRVPSDFHSALLTIVHAELSDRNYLLGRCDLRRMLDLALLMHRSPETVSEASLMRWFSAQRAKTAFDYHMRWLAFVEGREPPLQAGLVSGLLYKRSRFLDRHPRLLSASIRMIRPFIALRRDLGDAELRKDLRERVLRPAWWSKQVRVFSETRR